MKAAIPATMLLTWESQACQYPARGPEGVSYFRGYYKSAEDSGLLTDDPETYADCLLYRHNGRLLGILNHYPADNYWETKGNINMWVHPKHHREGIGTKLLNEAERRWGPIDYEQQRYTPAGMALVQSRLRKEAERFALRRP